MAPRTNVRASKGGELNGWLKPLGVRRALSRRTRNPGLRDLVGALSSRSDDFRRRWGAHNVRIHGTGVKHFHHHIVGDLTLAYETWTCAPNPASP